jgi:ABC-type nitrate/sulfonate/bicarbonate transport system permease component
MVAVWAACAAIFASQRVIPTPWAVVEGIWSDRDVYPTNIAVTLKEAAVGFLWGNLAAIAVAVLFVQIPIVERLLLQVAIASYCVPLVAVAPILVVVLSNDQPKEALAALAVFFTTLVATVLGLRSAQPATLDVVKAAGGQSWAQLRYVRVRSALPSLFAGIRIAAPAAVLGAIIGEYLGANQGLGVALVQAQSSFEVSRTWGIALVISAIAGLGYAVVSLIARLATPETHGALSANAFGDLGAKSSASLPSRLLTGAAFFTCSIGLIILLWYALIRAFHLNPFFAKTPLDVWRYLFTSTNAAQDRSQLLSNLATTAKDAVTGFLIGTAVAVAAAVLMVSIPLVRQAILPYAIVLRSVPLVAMTPLVALIFGRGLTGVTVVVGLVVFFPTLVNVTIGLRSAPRQTCDLVSSLGGNRWTIMGRVQLLYALPALFASARIAVPAALGGATLAEWLATGKGLGSLLVISYSNSAFNSLWSAAVLIVAVSVLVYTAISMAEQWIGRRFSA